MLTKREEQFLRTYERQLQSKGRFIVINGLVWALMVQLLIVGYNYFIQKKPLASQWSEGLPISLAIMPLAGLLYGWLMHGIISRRYRKIKEKERL